MNGQQLVLSSHVTALVLVTDKANRGTGIGIRLNHDRRSHASFYHVRLVLGSVTWGKELFLVSIGWHIAISTLQLSPGEILAIIRQDAMLGGQGSTEEEAGGRQ